MSPLTLLELTFPLWFCFIVLQSWFSTLSLLYCPMWPHQLLSVSLNHTPHYSSYYIRVTVRMWVQEVTEHIVFDCCRIWVQWHFASKTKNDLLPMCVIVHLHSMYVCTLLRRCWLSPPCFLTVCHMRQQIWSSFSSFGFIVLYQAVIFPVLCCVLFSTQLL